jgi:hypothetical protein
MHEHSESTNPKRITFGRDTNKSSKYSDPKNHNQGQHVYTTSQVLDDFESEEEKFGELNSPS